MIAPKEDPEPTERRIHLSQAMLQQLEALKLPIEELKEQIQRELEDQEEQ